MFDTRAMSAEMQRLRVEQVQQQLGAYEHLLHVERPRRGWLRAVREALGRTERQQAGVLGVSGPTLHKSEAAEADERISLRQLRKLARSLDCELVYGLVSRRPLTDVVESRARELATMEVNRVAHSMRLDGKTPSERVIERQIQQLTDELLRQRWSELWRA